jgi:hypothetical protein
MRGGNVYDLPPELFRHISSFAYWNNLDRPDNYQGFQKQNQFSDEDTVCYFNLDLNTVIVAFRGTQWYNPTDLYNDLIIAIKDTPTQTKIDHEIMMFKTIFKYFNNVQFWYPYTYVRPKFVLTGHSLGANVATQIYKYAEENLTSDDFNDQIACVVFNRGTTLWGKLDSGMEKKNDRYHHHIRGDVLSFSFLNDKTFNHFVYPAESYRNPYENHRLYTFDKRQLKY